MQLMSVLCVEIFVFNNTMRNMSKETPIPPTIASLSILNGGEQNPNMDMLSNKEESSIQAFTMTLKCILEITQLDVLLND